MVVLAGAAAFIAGALAGGLAFSFIMRFHDFFPGLLEQIPVVGPWLKLLLALVAGLAAFAITTAGVYERLAPKAKLPR